MRPRARIRDASCSSRGTTSPRSSGWSAEHAGFAVVEKRAETGDIAEVTDPRSR